MARIRQIKPEAFDDPDLNALPPLARWFFVGLWTQADKAGRLEDDPRRLKVRLLPFDEADADVLLNQLADANMLQRYESDGKRYIQIRSFPKHQNPHPREAESTIPPPKPQSREITRPATDKPGNAGPSNAESGSWILGSGSSHTGMAGQACVPHAPLHVSHKGHACCVRPCVPAFVHVEFRQRLTVPGVTEDEADRKLRAWYGEVETAWLNKPIGDDGPTFWRARFVEWQGSTRAGPNGRTMTDAEMLAMGPLGAHRDAS
jgi:hypothetical protein